MGKNFKSAKDITNHPQKEKTRDMTYRDTICGLMKLLLPKLDDYLGKLRLLNKDIRISSEVVNCMFTFYHESGRKKGASSKSISSIEVNCGLSSLLIAFNRLLRELG